MTVGRLGRLNAGLEEASLSAGLFEYSIVDDQNDQEWNVEAERGREQCVEEVFIHLAHFVCLLRRLPADLRRQRHEQAQNPYGYDDYVDAAFRHYGRIAQWSCYLFKSDK